MKISFSEKVSVQKINACNVKTNAGNFLRYSITLYRITIELELEQNY